MENLVAFISFLSDSQINATCALFGYLLELAVKSFFGMPMTISPAGKPDITIPINGKNRRTEIKQNGGDFRSNCKGESYIAYCVYVDINKPLNQQFGYIVKKSVFIDCANQVNMIREKTDSKGYKKTSLQTVYNYKLNDFHGSKGYKLADLLEQHGAIPFKEFFKA